MNEHTVVQYIGFQAKLTAREYTFNVHEQAREDIRYTLTILNEAFVSRLARYQDAPEICSLRLHRELDAHANHPPATNFCITEADLDHYRDSHKPKSRNGFQKRRDDNV